MTAVPGSEEMEMQGHAAFFGINDIGLEGHPKAEGVLPADALNAVGQSGVVRHLIRRQRIQEGTNFYQNIHSLYEAMSGLFFSL